MDDARPLEVTEHFRSDMPQALIADVVAAVREHVGRPDLSVSLLLTDDDEIARIHGCFLGDDQATDVISFPMDDGVELVVSVETAHRVADELGHPRHAEIALYIVHGTLHACGYDDIDDGDRLRMRAAERAILEPLGMHFTAVDE